MTAPVAASPPPPEPREVTDAEVETLVADTMRIEAERSEAESLAMIGVFSWKYPEGDDPDVDALSSKAYDLQLELSELAPQLAAALAALAQERSAAREREVAVRAEVGQRQVEAHMIYHANRECIQMTEDCQYERGQIDGLTRSVNGILSALTGPGSSSAGASAGEQGS